MVSVPVVTVTLLFVGATLWLTSGKSLNCLRIVHVNRRRRACVCDQVVKKKTTKSLSPCVKLTAVEHVSEEETGDQSPTSVDRRGTSGLSKLRVFSPAASPSAGILRKRQLSSDSVAVNDQSPTSPSAKVGRLHTGFVYIR